jgi:outer membrane protein assembly factor BamB
MRQAMMGLGAVLCLAAGAAAGETAEDAAAKARDLWSTSGQVNGGLAVHLGTTDGRLEAALRTSGAGLVHGLAADDSAVAGARAYLAAVRRAPVRTSEERLTASLRTGVSVEQGAFDRLPYADHIVNLLVADDLPGLLARGLVLTEVVRVLSPGGAACLGQTGDEPPGLADKLKAAGIETFERFSSPANGREPPAAGLQPPFRWVRFAKPRPKEMDEWPAFDHGPDGNPVSQDLLVGPATSLRWRTGPSWGLHSPDIVHGWVTGGGRMFYRLRVRTPDGHSLQDMLMARDAHNGLLLWQRPVKHWANNYGDRNVAVTSDGRLYTPLEPNGPLCALDVATGQLLKTYDKGGMPTYIICEPLSGQRPGNLYLSTRSKMWAVSAASGDLVWESPTGGQMVLADGRLYCLDERSVLTCLEPTTGRVVWKKEVGGRPNLYNNPLAYRGALVVTLGAGTEQNRYGLRCEAYALKDGAPLWSFQPKGVFRSGGCYAGEIFGAQGLLWLHIDVDPEPTRNNAGRRPSAWVGLDLLSGKIVKRHDDETSDAEVALLVANGIHRCNKRTATERYDLFGTYDFFEWSTGKYHSSNVTRSACGVDSGMMPANGLVYTPPFTCTCREFMERGFLVLAYRPEGVTEDDANRLRRGPAYGTKAALSSNADDWPMYRHDAARTGVAPTPVPADLEVRWQVPIGPGITAPVIAGGLALVGTDGHQVVAVSASDGKPAWRFTAGARIDSPPTVHGGLCLFGGRDGWVYCLRTADGELVWRFRAAPTEERIVVDGQLESAWPVHGSVLLQDGLAYVAAGRHTGLDGGVTLFALHPETGAVVWKQHLEHLQGNIKNANLPVGLLSGDGRSIHTTRWQFDPRTGDRNSYSWRKTGFVRFGDSGFRDNDWVGHENTKGRLEWSDGRTEGELLASGREMTFGVSALPSASGSGVRAGLGHYRLFGRKDERDKGWNVVVPLRMRALVAAGGTVFVAGQPDPPIPGLRGARDSRELTTRLAVVPPETLNPPGAELWAFTSDGQKIGALPLECAPAFDGLAAAAGRLYLSLSDGRLLCLAEKRGHS